MWKIFRCKRGEERWLIPGKSSRGELTLNSEEDIETLIKGIRNSLTFDSWRGNTRVIEYKKKLVVQSQREIGPFCVYKTFLEINKSPIYYSNSLIRYMNSIKSLRDKIIDKIIHYNPSDFLEILPRDTLNKMMEEYNEKMFGIKIHNKLPKFKINIHKCKPTEEVVRVLDVLENYS